MPWRPSKFRTRARSGEAPSRPSAAPSAFEALMPSRKATADEIGRLDAEFFTWR